MKTKPSLFLLLLVIASRRNMSSQTGGAGAPDDRQTGGTPVEHFSMATSGSDWADAEGAAAPKSGSAAPTPTDWEQVGTPANLESDTGPSIDVVAAVARGAAVANRRRRSRSSKKLGKSRVLTRKWADYSSVSGLSSSDEWLKIAQATDEL